MCGYTRGYVKVKVLGSYLGRSTWKHIGYDSKYILFVPARVLANWKCVSAGVCGSQSGGNVHTFWDIALCWWENLTNSRQIGGLWYPHHRAKLPGKSVLLLLQRSWSGRRIEYLTDVKCKTVCKLSYLPSVLFSIGIIAKLGSKLLHFLSFKVTKT